MVAPTPAFQRAKRGAPGKDSIAGSAKKDAEFAKYVDGIIARDKDEDEKATITVEIVDPQSTSDADKKQEAGPKCSDNRGVDGADSGTSAVGGSTQKCK